jgi:hypothetical protein
MDDLLTPAQLAKILRDRQVLVPEFGALTKYQHDEMMRDRTRPITDTPPEPVRAGDAWVPAETPRRVSGAGRQRKARQRWKPDQISRRWTADLSVIRELRTKAQAESLALREVEHIEPKETK